MPARGAGLIGVCALLCGAQARAVECPAAIPVQQSLAPATLDGWQAYDTKQGPGYNFYGV